MSQVFDDATVSAVLAHMNADHPDDSTLIVRAFAPEVAAASATMARFDGDGGTWIATTADGAEREVTVPWPGGPITARPEVRREIVALYDLACERLGVPPRAHG